MFRTELSHEMNALAGAYLCRIRMFHNIEVPVYSFSVIDYRSRSFGTFVHKQLLDDHLCCTNHACAAVFNIFHVGCRGGDGSAASSPKLDGTETFGAV